MAIHLIERQDPAEARLWPDRAIDLPCGMDVRFVDEGTGFPVVFVHGVMADHRQWFHNLPDFARHHRTIAVDLPGHGRSGRLTGWDYSVPRLAEAVLSLLDHLSIERAVLVGNSLGGHVSLQATLLAPERVERLILVDPAGARLGPLERLAIGLVGRLDAARFYRSWMDPVTARAVLRRNHDSVIVQAYRRHYEAVLACPDRRRMTTEVLYRCLSSVDRHHLEGRCHRIVQPVFLIWGAGDKLINRRYARRLAAELPDARLHVYDGVGHVPSIEVPDDFNRRSLAFLEDLR